MKTIRKIFHIPPKATKGEPTNNVSDNWSDQVDKRAKRFKYFLKVTRIYFLGSQAERIRKPVITSFDCVFVLICIHFNIRFFCQYIDLSLEWGGFMVWLTFSIINIIICPPIALIYSFLGNYGQRSYLHIWHMMPFFQGLTICMTFVELIKLIQTSLILSSGFLSFRDFFLYSSLPSRSPITCNETKFRFKPGIAVAYGHSKRFTDSGYKLGRKDITNWDFNNERANYLLLVWFCVIVFRTFQFQRYKKFILRGAPFTLTAVCLLCMVINAIMNANPVSQVVRISTENLAHVEAYLQIFVFSLREYLPSYWITIGYLCEKPTLISKVWLISGMKIICSYFLLFWIPYVAEDFKIFANVESDACLHFFGIHFIFVMIPNTITAHFWLSSLFYLIYFTAVMMCGFAHMILCMDMLSFSVPLRKKNFVRYRNLIFIVFAVSICAFSMAFCVEGIHYILFFINAKAHYVSNMFILSAATFAMAVYGLYRIVGDYLFLTGMIFVHSTAVKMLFVGMFMTSSIFILDLFTYDYRLEDNSTLYTAIIGICVFPFSYGVWKTMSNKTKYHGYCQPLNIWGMESAHLRNQRRKKTLHTMYSYRMKHSCTHNCLLNHPLLMKEIDNNLIAQEIYLNIMRTTLFKSVYERDSRTTEKMEKAQE